MNRSNEPVPQGKRARLRAATWGTWDKSPEERRLVQRVDWWLLSYACLVMALAGAKNVQVIFALRFFIGLFEASVDPGIITLLSNWYTPQELAKRAAIFQASSSAGNMFSR
ncbi:hypothetical protein BDV06DRAFT_220107 [Aspergillus oleicola]